MSAGSDEEQWRPRREARTEAAAVARTITPAKAAARAGGPASPEGGENESRTADAAAGSGLETGDTNG